jgi:hypothetical protein
VLLLIAIGWELSGYFIIGHSVNPERWRVIAYWSVMIGAVVLSILVLAVGPFINPKDPAPKD